MVTGFSLQLLHTFLYKWMIFENFKTSVEACFLHNKILINRLVSSHKENKIIEHHFSMIITHLKVLIIKTFDSKQKAQKALKCKKLVFWKDWQKTQTSINPFKQNSDYTSILRKVRFRSSFKWRRTPEQSENEEFKAFERIISLLL